MATADEILSAAQRAVDNPDAVSELVPSEIDEMKKILVDLKPTLMDGNKLEIFFVGLVAGYFLGKEQE